MSMIVVEMSAREAALWRAQQRLIQQQGQLQQGYARVGQSAARAGQRAKQSAEQTRNVGQMVKTQLLSIVGALGVGGGLAGAIGLVRRGFESWLEIMQDIAAESRKASSEIIAFAALQEGGVKAERVQAASQLAMRYGITERAEAFDTVQAMQSMLGSFEEGMQAAETIFAARQVGIPVDLGRELEVLGISAKMAPGEATRMAFAAGEASGRTPTAMARAAQALPFWEDKKLMFAAGAELAGAVPEERIGTYMKRLGTALSPTSGLGKWYEEQGLGPDASQWQRFEMLAEKSLDTQIELKEAGLTERREILAVLATVPHIERIAELMKEIPEKAQPGLLARERAEVEAEVPGMRHERQMRMLATAFAEEAAHGRGAEPGRQWEEKYAVRGLALRRLGWEQAGPIRTVTKGEEGKPETGPGRWWWARVMAASEILAGPPVAGLQTQLRFDVEEEKIQSWMLQNRPEFAGARAALDRERAGAGAGELPLVRSDLGDLVDLYRAAEAERKPGPAATPGVPTGAEPLRVELNVPEAADLRRSSQAMDTAAANLERTVQSLERLQAVRAGRMDPLTALGAGPERPVKK